MLKWVDIPPVWLAGMLVLAWMQKTYYPIGDFGPVFGGLLGGLLVGGGLILAGLAVVEMRKAHTTVIPHREADRLVTSGIFKRSRNPIYVGDVMILAGLILYWGAALALPLVPVLVWVLEKRFVEPEERRLRHKFPRDFMRYEKETRRWV